MPRRRIQKVTSEIKAQQNNEHQILRGAIVGRSLNFTSEDDINRQLRSRTPDIVNYRRTGQVALVYLYRDALKKNRGTTFYNLADVKQAIAKAPQSSKQRLVVARGHLELVESPYLVSDKGVNYFWLSARGKSAVDAFSKQPVDIEAEERAIAQELLGQDTDTTGEPNLWLGAIAALNLDSAYDAADKLETIIPARIQTHAVSLVRWRGES